MMNSQVRRLATALLTAGLALGAARAESQSSGLPGDDFSAHIQLDNDLFTGAGRDRDYTGGLGVTITGAAAREGLLSIDGALARLDRLFLETADLDVRHARQFGFAAFTPADTLAVEVVESDRPYASLFFVSNARVYVDDGGRKAWSSSLSLGVLGLPFAERLHSAVHDAIGSERPHGYEHQISAGGEPTARYSLAQHRLWIAHPSGTMDVKATVQGSVGYLTETSASVSVRVGRFRTPWWSFAPELTDYIAAATPVQRLRSKKSAGDLYFFAGGRIKARGYNAFLQGQFRESELRYAYGEIEPIVAQAWLGLVTEVFEQTQLSYTLNYQTAELRGGEGARSALWAGVQLARVF